jgi:SAM-dependent methyltransferase
MADRLNLEQIRDFWTEQAAQHKLSAAASWADPPMIELEIQEVVKQLADGDRILDVGCANGYSTVQVALRRAVHLRGLDYIPEMIEHARLRLQDPDLVRHLKGSVEFAVGNIMTLDEPPATYDKVIVIRVVINLEQYANQVAALRECARVLKPGGVLVLCDSTQQGWERLNHLRREWGLADIPMPRHNLFLDEERIVADAAPDLELVSLTDFSSTYCVATRVLKPLLIQALGLAIDPANTTMEWNRWCAQLPSFGDYGKQKLFVFRKP